MNVIPLSCHEVLYSEVNLFKARPYWDFVFIVIFWRMYDIAGANYSNILTMGFVNYSELRTIISVNNSLNISLFV